MKISLAAAVIVAATLVGCGHTESYVALLRPEAPSERRVEVYVDAIPKRPFTDAAILQTIGYGNRANAEELVKAMLVEASRVGCDAVVRVQFDYGATSAHATGVCVRYTAPPPPTPPPTPTIAPPVPAPPMPVDAGVEERRM